VTDDDDEEDDDDDSYPRWFQTTNKNPPTNSPPWQNPQPVPPSLPGRHREVQRSLGVRRRCEGGRTGPGDVVRISGEILGRSKQLQRVREIHHLKGKELIHVSNY